jgi:hypothetical protein
LQHRVKVVLLGQPEMDSVIAPETPELVLELSVACTLAASVLFLKKHGLRAIEFGVYPFDQRRRWGREQRV